VSSSFGAASTFSFSQQDALGEVSQAVEGFDSQAAGLLSVLQQERFAGWDWTGFASAGFRSSGGVTSLALAQASFCVVVKQQQERQHCSADAQPQPWLSQGNRTAEETIDTAGIGAPTAVATCITRSSHTTGRTGTSHRRGETEPAMATCGVSEPTTEGMGELLRLYLG